MFTGLVEGRGFVDQVRPDGVDDFSAPRADSTLRLTIQVPDDFGPPGTLGESVAINGCYLDDKVVLPTQVQLGPIAVSPSSAPPTNSSTTGTGYQ